MMVFLASGENAEIPATLKTTFCPPPSATREAHHSSDHAAKITVDAKRLLHEGCTI
jgi:hypothetical protein